MDGRLLRADSDGQLFILKLSPLIIFIALLAFVLTFAAAYGLALWRGPAGFYDTIVFSVPQYALPSAGWAFVVTLVVNTIWWVVVLLPSGIKRPAPT